MKNREEQQASAQRAEEYLKRLLKMTDTEREHPANEGHLLAYRAVQCCVFLSDSGLDDRQVLRLVAAALTLNRERG